MIPDNMYCVAGWLLLAKTSGPIVFGVANAFVPILLAWFLTDLSGVA